jgi:hypothetical protein
VSIIISLSFHFVAPTCFGNCVPSSGSLPVPSELHANFGVWLIKFCVVCGCVYITWQPGTPDRYMAYTQPHTTQNFINQTPKLACNSEGTGELPKDGTQLPEHVGAAK